MDNEFRLSKFRQKFLSWTRKKIIHTANNTQSILKSNWPGILLVLIVVVNHFLPIAPKPDPAFDKPDAITVLTTGDRGKHNPQELNAHNNSIYEFLIQWVVIENEGIATRESSLMQMRGFYAIIVAALISVVLVRDKQVSRTAALILMSIIVIMYTLEVHQIDLNKRYNQKVSVYSRDVLTLAETPDQNKTWFKVDDTSLESQMTQAGFWMARWPRVILTALRPEVDQLALYVFPFLVLFWWYPKKIK